MTRIVDVALKKVIFRLCIKVDIMRLYYIENCTSSMYLLTKYFQGYPHYEKKRVDGGCCTGPQIFHERCYCAARLDFCKSFCDKDINCQGYVGEGSNLCQIATTSRCPPSNGCEKNSIDSIGSLDPYETCGSGLDGCFLKTKGGIS